MQLTIQKIFFSIYEPLNCILDMCSEDSKNKFFLAYSELHELMQSSPGSWSAEINDHIKEIIKNYGTNKTQKNEEFAKASDIILKNYSSYFNQESKISVILFYMQTYFFVKVRRFLDFFQL